MNWKSTAIVSGAGLLATWLGWNSQPVYHATAPAAVPAGRVPPSTAVDVQQQAAKLESRVRGAAEYHAPSRNPFRFGARPPRPTTAATPVAPQTSAAPIPSAPTFQVSLLGIAADDAGGTLMRTAIFGTPSGVVLARAGESIGAGYRVGTIGENAVDIIDADGAVRTLTLRP